MASDPGPQNENTSNTAGENEAPLTAVLTSPIRTQEELRSEAATVAEAVLNSDATTFFDRIQREIDNTVGEQGELRQAYVRENLNAWLIEAINDVGRQNITSPDSEEWRFIRSFLPPWYAAVGGEVVELPGAERRPSEWAMLRDEVLEAQAELQSEIRGDDVLTTGIRNERDRLRTRVGVLEEQLQVVSDSDDPRILAIMLDQTRYTTMKQQRDAYFQKVQTLEVEVKRLLDYGLGDGGACEQRMRTERDEIKYSYDELQHQVKGPDGYLAQIKALQSKPAEPGATGGDPLAQLAAVREELRLERQRVKIAQRTNANLRNCLDQHSAGMVAPTIADWDALFRGRDEEREQYDAQDRAQTSEMKDWIHKVQQYTNAAPDILKNLEDEPSSMSQPATQDERHGVIEWFRGLVELTNNPPSQSSSPALPFFRPEPPPPDRKAECPKQLALARQQFSTAAQDAYDMPEVFNTFMWQKFWGADSAQHLEQALNEQDVAVQKEDDLEAKINSPLDQAQANETWPEQLRRAVARIRKLEAELLTAQEKIKFLSNRGQEGDSYLVRLRDERDAEVQNAKRTRTELERQVAEALAELESTRNALVASSADRDVAIAERDATLLGTGSQHDDLKRLRQLMQSNDNAHAAQLAQIQTKLDLEVQEVTRLRDELGEALRGQQPVPPNDDCRERLALAETERDTAIKVQELIAESRQEAYTERDLARAERDSLAYELDDANTDRARLQADIRRSLQYDEAAALATSFRLEGERDALVRVIRDRQQPTSEEAVILQNMGLLATAEITMVNALASEVISTNRAVTDMVRQMDILQTELANLRLKNPKLPAAAPVQSDPANLLAIQAAELAHNATRRRLDQVQGELDRLRNAQAAARINFDPAVVDLQTLPDTIVLQQLLNTRDEGAAQDREALHATILTTDTGRVALEEMQRKLRVVREQRDRILAGQSGAQIDDNDDLDNDDLPRQLEFTTAALERVRQQRDAMLAAASANYSLEANLPTRYRTLLEAYDIVLDERNRLERVVSQSNIPRDGGEAANGSNGATEKAEQRDIMRSDILQDRADAQRERDFARADRTEAEVQRNAARAREARTAEELRTTSARLQTAQSIIAGNSTTDPRDDLILQLSRRVRELAQLATTAQRREVDTVAELHFQRELAFNDPFKEDMVATLEDQEARTQRAEDARLVVERARLRDITEARGQTDIALAALGREETTSAGLHAVRVRLRAEVVARGGTTVGDEGQVERENYDEARWDEAGLREQENQPRIHYAPYRVPAYDINYRLREDWPPSYQPGSELVGVGDAPPELVQELSDQDDRIDLLELARINLRDRLVALGGAVVGPNGEVQGESFNQRRWNRAARRERDGRDRIHYNRAMPHSPSNPLREDWPIQYQPSPNDDHNPLQNMSHDPSPRVPGAANSDRGVGIPPPTTPNQRRTASDRVFSDPGSINEPIIILSLSTLTFPQPPRSPSPIRPTIPPSIPPVPEFPATPPETLRLLPSPRIPRPASDPAPSNAPPASPEKAVPVPEDQVPEAPVKEHSVENNPAEHEPSTTPPGSPPPPEEEVPTGKTRKPKPAPAAAGPPRRSSRLGTVPPADYTGGTKRKDPDDKTGGGGKRRKK